MGHERGTQNRHQKRKNEEMAGKLGGYGLRIVKKNSLD